MAVGGPAMAPAAWWPGAGAGEQEEMRWRQLDGGVSAVSFGFVATAMLVSMFLAMAVLEHFLRSPPPSPPRGPRGILLRLLRRGNGSPGADLEAARKLDGGCASPEVVIQLLYTPKEYNSFIVDKSFMVVTESGPSVPASIQVQMPVYSKGVSVLMPGHDVPTFIAHPAPVPCPPERVRWPSHQPAPFASSSSYPS